MSNNPNEELKKLEQQLLAVEEENGQMPSEAEAEDDALIIPEEEEGGASEGAVQEPFVERDEEFELFYQDILKEFGPDTKPRRKTSSTTKAVRANTYSDHTPAKPKKGVKGLVITLCLEILGITGIVLWWILRIL